MGQVQIEQADGVARITLEAPPMNAMDRAMVAQLEQALATCARDDAVRAVIVQGAGTRAFSAGSDLTELRALIARGAEALAGKIAQDQRVFGALARLPKPTVAAVEGVAIGGGLELAVCCDFVVASRSSKFALPEIRLGVFPGSGGTVRVTQRIGAARARRMMMLGDTLDADTALAWSLVDELADAGAVLQHATELAQRLARGPARALQGCKAAIAAALDCGEDAALALADRWAADLGFTEDAAEGLKAFDEKRAPVFGRTPIRRE